MVRPKIDARRKISLKTRLQKENGRITYHDYKNADADTLKNALKMLTRRRSVRSIAAKYNIPKLTLAEQWKKYQENKEDYSSFKNNRSKRLSSF